MSSIDEIVRQGSPKNPLVSDSSRYQCGQLFMWVPGFQTPVLRVVWQVFDLLSHLLASPAQLFQCVFTRPQREVTFSFNKGENNALKEPWPPWGHTEVATHIPIL